MTEASENNAPPENASPEPSPELSPPKVSLQDMTNSHMMLKGFHAAVREGTFAGQFCRDIALGLDFLDRMINTSHQQLEFAKRIEKEMKGQPKNGNEIAAR